MKMCKRRFHVKKYNYDIFNEKFQFICCATNSFIAGVLESFIRKPNLNNTHWKYFFFFFSKTWMWTYINDIFCVMACDFSNFCEFKFFLQKNFYWFGHYTVALFICWWMERNNKKKIIISHVGRIIYRHHRITFVFILNFLFDDRGLETNISHAFFQQSNYCERYIKCDRWPILFLGR